MEIEIPEPDKIALYGLGAMMIIAGASKFFILSYWLGFEPQLLKSVVPFSSETLTMAGGIFEIVLGLLLLSGRKTFYAASATTLWLSAITLQVVNLGMWTVAIRDFGLVILGLSVALHSRK